MSRIKELKKEIHRILAESIQEEDRRADAAAHLHSVALAAAMLARMRGQDPELAAMAGLLHDMYAYRNGTYEDHAHRGAEYARGILEELGITNDAETGVICSAIYHHDSKAETGTPMDEILKDADVLHHALGDPAKEVKPHELERFRKLSAEFGFQPE